jgi:hypothetical protein
MMLAGALTISLSLYVTMAHAQNAYRDLKNTYAFFLCLVSEETQHFALLTNLHREMKNY